MGQGGGCFALGQRHRRQDGARHAGAGHFRVDAGGGPCGSAVSSGCGQSAQRGRVPGWLSDRRRGDVARGQSMSGCMDGGRGKTADASWCRGAGPCRGRSPFLEQGQGGAALEGGRDGIRVASLAGSGRSGYFRLRSVGQGDDVAAMLQLQRVGLPGPATSGLPERSRQTRR